jgi:hypothetical protein
LVFLLENFPEIGGMRVAPIKEGLSSVLATPCERAIGVGVAGNDMVTRPEVTADPAVIRWIKGEPEGFVIEWR